MSQAGILFISLLSILLLPFPNGQAESKDRDRENHPHLFRWRAA